MSSKKIVFDLDAFIPDRYFSHQSHIVNGMDMYKDQGRLLPKIAPVQHHQDITPPKNFRKPPAILPHLPLKDKKGTSRKSLSVPPQKKKVQLKKAKKTEKQTQIKPEPPEEKPKEESAKAETNGEAPKKKRRKKEVIEEEEPESIKEPEISDDEESEPEEKDYGLFNFKYVIEKSKEALRRLETPMEIYQRCHELNQIRERNSDETVDNMEKLKKIVKKLDLTVEVGYNSHNSRALNQVKKVPLEFFQKAREKKYKTRLNKSALELPSNSQNLNQNSSNLESSLIKIRRTNITMDTIVDAAEDKEEDGEEEEEEGASPLKKWQEFKNKQEKTSTYDVLKYEEEAFLSPMQSYLGIDHPSFASQEVSSKSIFDSRRENVIMDTIMKRLQMKKAIPPPSQNTKKAEVNPRETRKWAIRKVSLIGINVNSLKTKTSEDLDLVKNYRKTLSKDVGKIERQDSEPQQQQSGDSDEEEDDNLEYSHYDDAIEENMKKFAKGRFELNFSKVQIKNKRERSIDNIRFEKQMSKMEKKIIERARSKSSIPGLHRMNTNLKSFTSQKV